VALHEHAEGLLGVPWVPLGHLALDELADLLTGVGAVALAYLEVLIPDVPEVKGSVDFELLRLRAQGGPASTLLALSFGHQCLQNSFISIRAGMSSKLSEYHITMI